MKPKIAFFGTPNIASIALDELHKKGILPDLIITNPDAPVGRKQILTPPPVKTWAEEHHIPVTQPRSLKDEEFAHNIKKTDWDLFVVVAYGKIIPSWLIDLPKHGILNLHPSLLPKLRGASPIRSAILNDERETGVTIMLMDEELDHGPIIKQEVTPIPTENWPLDGENLDIIMAKQGGCLLAEVIPLHLENKITPIPQNHDTATFCTKIDKSMSEIKLDPYHLPTGKEAYQALLKIRAFAGWPETFFIYNDKRFKIKKAEIVNDKLNITRVIPEGKTETDFSLCFKK